MQNESVEQYIELCSCNFTNATSQTNTNAVYLPDKLMDFKTENCGFELPQNNTGICFSEGCTEFIVIHGCTFDSLSASAVLYGNGSNVDSVKRFELTQWVFTNFVRAEGSERT